MQRNLAAVADNDNNQRPAAFDALLVAHLPGLRNFAKRRTSPDKVDELVQDTVAYALSKWANYRAEEDAFATWLQWQMCSVLTRNRESVRRKKRAAKEVSFDVVELAVRLSEPARQENIVDAATLMRRLSYTREGRLLAQIAKGETQRELAKKRGISDSRVDQLVQKARARVRRTAA